MSTYIRLNQRANDALRPVTILPNVNPYAEGSVLISYGNTKVICTASIEEKVPPHKKDSGEGWLTAEYGMLPRSTHSRMPREAAKGKQSGRTQEIQRLIGRSLRAVFDLKKLGQRTIHLDCDVIQADGGTRTASITGAFVAAQLAVEKLLEQKIIKHNPIKTNVAAVSVGLLGSTALLDLAYEEDSVCDTDLNLVMTKEGQYIEIQGTAEGEPFSQAQLAELLSLGNKGIQELISLQQQISNLNNKEQ